jgi:CHAT domain-containing protein
MQHFYRLRAENPAITKAEALHLAQLTFIRGQTTVSDNREATRGMKVSSLKDNVDVASLTTDSTNSYTHPFYWAPFVLMGNWL